ncbi:MAG TPA: diadenylate cyclase CdaA [Vicinamibacteria bacterium]|nr:diadenylate cyclase CdaA [Vicinamibacteria bacterium]
MSTVAEFLWDLARDLTWTGVIDILLVSYLFYKLFQLIRGGRAFQMVVGSLVLVLFFFVSRWAQLATVNWLLRNSLAYVGFAVIVLYQQELRKALSQLGQAPLFRFLNPSSSKGTIDEVVFAMIALAQRRIGGIVVLERDIGLRSYIEGGVVLDAVVTYDLMLSIFNPKSPLHDGAVIVQGNRVAAAACFLPISINPQLSRALGTRHRAALGITEDTDAVAIVVSEETGVVSFVENGSIVQGLDSDGLRQRIRGALGQSEPPSDGDLEKRGSEQTGEEPSRTGTVG